MYNYNANTGYSIYKLSVTHERFEVIQIRLGHKIELLERDDEFTTFELRVESALDILAMFHSGLDYGMKKYLFDKTK